MLLSNESGMSSLDILHLCWTSHRLSMCFSFMLPLLFCDQDSMVLALHVSDLLPADSLLAKYCTLCLNISTSLDHIFNCK